MMNILPAILAAKLPALIGGVALAGTVAVGAVTVAPVVMPASAPAAEQVQAGDATRDQVQDRLRSTTTDAAAAEPLQVRDQVREQVASPMPSAQVRVMEQVQAQTRTGEGPGSPATAGRQDQVAAQGAGQQGGVAQGGNDQAPGDQDQTRDRLQDRASDCTPSPSGSPVADGTGSQNRNGAGGPAVTPVP